MAESSGLRASWGIASTSPVTGIVTDVSCGGEPILAPLHDELGAVIGQAFYDEHKTAECTVLIKHGEDLPERGETITIGDVTGYVTNARRMESNQQYCRCSISIEAYANCTETTKVS